MSEVRGWQLYADWSGGTGFNGTLEDITQYVNRDDVVASWGRPTDTVSLSTPTSELGFALINRTRDWDRWFSPENTASPIYGKVLPGRATKLTKRARDGRQLYSESFTTATGTGGWALVSGGAISRVGSPSEDGNGALEFAPNGTTATTGVYHNRPVFFGDEPKGTIQYTARVRSTFAHADAALVIDWYDPQGNYLDTSGVTNLSPTTAGTWITVQSTAATPPAGAVQMRVRWRLGSTPAANNFFRMDSITAWHEPNDAGQIFTVHSGVLDEINVDSQGSARTFTGRALDAWGRPNGATLSTEVYPSIRTGTAINTILDLVGWTGGRAIDAGVTVIPYWWEEGTDPGDAIDKLVRSEGPPAIAYVEAGTFVFRDRHHRIRSAASNTSQSLFSLILPAGEGPGHDFKVEKGSFVYDHGLRSIVNKATFSVEQRRPLDFREVWSMDDPISMDSGESTTLSVEASDPSINVRTPSVADDTLVVQAGSFTVSIDRTSGQRFTITIDCITTGTIRSMMLVGNPISVVRTVQWTSSDPGSMARYGTSSWPDDVPWCNLYDARAIADRIVAVYADNRPRVSFTLVAFNDRYTSEMLRLRISDRVTIRNDILGINRDFHVERLTHTVSRWQVHRLTVEAIAVEPTQATNALTFGVAGKGFDQGTFAVNGIDSATTMFIFNTTGQGFGQGVFAN